METEVLAKKFADGKTPTPLVAILPLAKICVRNRMAGKLLLLILTVVVN
jgi:hypothetical protein